MKLTRATERVAGKTSAECLFATITPLLRFLSPAIRWRHFLLVSLLERPFGISPSFAPCRTARVLCQERDFRSTECGFHLGKVLSKCGPRPSLLLWGTTFIAILCQPLEDLRERLLVASFLQFLLVEKSRSASTRFLFFPYSRWYNDLRKSVWLENVHVSLSSLSRAALPGKKKSISFYSSLYFCPPPRESASSSILVMSLFIIACCLSGVAFPDKAQRQPPVALLRLLSPVSILHCFFWCVSTIERSTKFYSTVEAICLKNKLLLTCLSFFLFTELPFFSLASFSPLRIQLSLIQDGLQISQDIFFCSLRNCHLWVQLTDTPRTLAFTFIVNISWIMSPNAIL